MQEEINKIKDNYLLAIAEEISKNDSDIILIKGSNNEFKNT
ncbi:MULTISPECIES: hypothetical protein [unclassified Gemella]|nr:MULTISPECIES: hypothetical protein [unclassified Gemella]